MAASTPFKVNELTDSFMRLNAAGFDVDMKSMRKLGDLAANTTGKGISDLTETMLSASRGQGAMIDNFNGMSGKAKNGALEIQSLDSKTGKLTKTMVKAGDKTALLTAYLNAASETDTQGAMERLSKTAKGLASTLSDNIDLALLAFYKSIEGSLKSLMKTATDAAKSFKPLARDFGVFIKLNLPSVLDKIKSAMKLIGPLTKVAAVAAGLFVANWLGFKTLAIANLLFNAVVALRAMKVAQVAATVAQWAFNASVMFIPAVIGAAILAVAALAYDFYQFFTTGNSMLLKFTEQWPWLHTAITTVYNLIVAFGMSISQMMPYVVSAIQMIGKVFLLLPSIVATVAAAIITGVLNLAAIIGGAIMAMGGVFTSVFMNILNYALETGSGITSSIMGALTSIGGWLASLPAMASTAFAGLLSAAKRTAKNMPIIGTAMKMAGFNKGGFVGGTGNTDTVPAILTPGEFVINKGMAQKLMSGDPSGLSDLSKQMNAPSLASVGSQPMTQQSAGSYSVPSSSVASTNYNITINAPLTQTNNISGMGGSPSDVGNQIGASASSRFNRGLSNAARQVPQRVSRA